MNNLTAEANLLLKVTVADSFEPNLLKDNTT